MNDVRRLYVGCDVVLLADGLAERLPGNFVVHQHGERIPVFNCQRKLGLLVNHLGNNPDFTFKRKPPVAAMPPVPALLTNPFPNGTFLYSSDWVAVGVLDR